MHSRSTCNCYCKTDVPLVRQKEEIHSNRGHIKLSSRRNVKKIPLIPAKLVDDEQSKSKRSTTTSPISPVLSPETTAALEDTERLIKNAEIQIKEINAARNCACAQNYINTYTDQACLDDENDQLLYIRELVTYKFHEANGWINTNHENSKSRKFMDEIIKPRKIIDFSNPKFRTSEERYQEFLQQRKPQNRKFETSIQIADDVCKSNEKTKPSNETSTFVRESTKNIKIDTCSIQTCPSVDVKRELIAQNLEGIRISPEMFVQESLNVGTYLISHDSRKENPSTTRKEKFVKILSEESENTASSIRAINSKQKKGDSKQLNENKNNSSTSISKEKSEEVSVEATEVLPEDNEGFSSKIEIKQDLKLTLNEGGVDLNEAKLKRIDNCNEESRITENVLKDKQDMNCLTEVTSELRNDQRQVRFSEEIVEEVQEKLKVESHELGKHVSEENKTRDNCHSLLDYEIETKCLINEERRKEMYEKEKRGKEHYKIIDQHFFDIVKKYCSKEINYSERNHSAASIEDSLDDSNYLDDLHSLHEPSIDQFDNLLAVYSRIIDNVSRSMKTIDKFLFRPEIRQYCDSEECVSSTPSCKNEIGTMTDKAFSPFKRKFGAKSRDLAFKHQLPFMNTNINQERRRRTSKATSSYVKPCLLKRSDNNSRSSLFASKRSNELLTKTDSKTNEQHAVSKRFNRNEKISDHIGEAGCFKQVRVEGLPLPQGKNSDTSLTSSVNSTSSNTRLQNIKKKKMFQTSSVDYATCETTNFPEQEERNLLYSDVNSTMLYNTVRSNTLKQILWEMNNAENSIVGVLREEAQFIEEKIRNAFNIKEIAVLLTKDVLENLRDEASKLEMIPRNPSQNEQASMNIQIIQKLDSRKNSLKNEENFNVTEIIKDLITVPLIDNPKIQPSIKYIEDESKCESLMIEEIRSIKDDVNVISSKETMIIPRSITENIKLLNDVKERGSSSTPKSFEENGKDSGRQEARNDVKKNIKEEINVCKGISGDSNQISTTMKNEDIKDTMQHAAEAQDRNLQQISSSDSLHNCESLQSSSKNISKVLLNISKSSREVNGIERTLKTSNYVNNENPNGATSVINVAFDRTLHKDRILSELYNDVYKKASPSTFNTNHSGTLIQNQRLSNSASAITSKIETSSDSSHSEGELQMPSSNSYSIGEVRILTSNPSDGENTDDNIRITPLFD